MDRDDKELVCQQFAQAAATLERAHDLAMNGQAPRLTANMYRRKALRLRQLGGEVVAMADAILALMPNKG